MQSVLLKKSGYSTVTNLFCPLLTTNSERTLRNPSLFLSHFSSLRKFLGLDSLLLYVMFLVCFEKEFGIWWETAWLTSYLSFHSRPCGWRGSCQRPAWPRSTRRRRTRRRGPNKARSEEGISVLKSALKIKCAWLTFIKKVTWTHTLNIFYKSHREKV